MSFDRQAPVVAPGVRPGPRPIRKDEQIIADRGLYIESWLPERRSRRMPLYLLHGELCGSWLWERYLGYFAGRGWEAHALNLRAHFWSETADLARLNFQSYLDDAAAGLARLRREPVLVGHGLGGLLAMRLAERGNVGGLVLISPALPGELRAPGELHELRSVPAIFRQDLIGWGLPEEQLRRQNRDLTDGDVARINHFLGAESGAARRDTIVGVAVSRELLPDVPILVIGGGLDRLYPELDSERLAGWLGAEYQPFGAHSHFGLVVGEESYLQVADAVRSFLEAHKL